MAQTNNKPTDATDGGTVQAPTAMTHAKVKYDDSKRVHLVFKSSPGRYGYNGVTLKSGAICEFDEATASRLVYQFPKMWELAKGHNATAFTPPDPPPSIKPVVVTEG